MLNLIPAPYRILALVAAFALSNAVTAYRFYHTGYALAEASHAAALIKAQADVAQKQKALAGGIQRAAEDVYNDQVETEKRLALADGAVERLRETIRAANGRANSAATAATDGAIARTLLADCAVEYRDVAKAADRLRGVVIGLQGYARAVSR